MMRKYGNRYFSRRSFSQVSFFPANLFHANLSPPTSFSQQFFLRRTFHRHFLKTRKSTDSNFLKARNGLVSFVLVWLGLIRIGENFFDQVRLGQNRFGFAWFGLDWFNLVRLNQVRLSYNVYQMRNVTELYTLILRSVPPRWSLSKLNNTEQQQKKHFFQYPFHFLTNIGPE